MSIYLTFDEGPGEQIASNTGWGDFCRWAGSDGKLGALCAHGHAAVAGLADALSAKLQASPPPTSDVRATADGLLALLRANADEEIAIVSGGLT